MTQGGKVDEATHNLLRRGPTKGRGAASYVRGRFEKTVAEAEDDGWGSIYAVDEGETDAPPKLRTEVTVERARSIISRNQSPDLPFSQSLNPYRGCEHGWTFY
jgi:hypothetical protein